MVTGVRRFGVFELNTGIRQLHKQGRRVRLQEQPLRVLEILLERPGELVTREELKQRLWPSGVYVDSELGLNGAIKRLRLALGDSADNPRFIETVPKSGYRFLAPVQTAGLAGPIAGETGGSSSTILASIPPSGPLAVLTQESAEAASTPWPTTARSGRSRCVRIGVFLVATLGTLGYLARPQTPALRVTRIVNLSHSVHAWHRESLLYDQFLAISRGEADAERFSRLWLVPVVGGPPRRLGSLQTNDFAWSPDGSSLVFARHSQLFLAGRDGTGAHPLATVPGHAFYLRWSPDSSRLRFTVRDERGQLSIWEVSAKGENLHQLKFKWSGALAEGFGDWTPDGRYYLFVSRREGVSNLWALEEKSDWLHRRRSEPMQLTAGPISYTRLLAGRDDTQLFALGTQRGGELMRYDLAKKEFVPFLGGRSAEHLNFTRDGRWVTYVAYPEGTLWRARSDGSQQLQLTFPPLLARNPQWSPDGKRILFEAARFGELGKIYAISIDGGAPELLVSEPYAQSSPNWWPTGDSIIYSLHKMGGNEDVCRIDLHNGHVERVPFTGGLSRPLLSPDGRNLAAQPADTVRQYVIVDLKTGKRTLLTKRNVDDLTWSPDSQYIYFYTQDALLPDKPALFRIRISDSKEEKITDVSMSTTGINGSRIGLAPDGSPLLLRDRDQTDAYGLSLAKN